MAAQHSTVFTVSDLHAGKGTESYSPTVARERLWAAGDKLDDLYRNHARGSSELVVCLLGDIVDGTGIFPTQPHHQAETSALQQVKEAALAINKFVNTLRKRWGKVRVAAVPGNHGRASRFAHEIDNWDNVLYEQLKGTFSGAVEFGYGLPFYKVKVQDSDILLYHGHGIRISNGIPYAGINARVGKFLRTKLAPFDTIMMGHFHVTGAWMYSGVNVILSGTSVTDDMYVRELGYEGENFWWAYGVEPGNPMAWQVKLPLI